ncbi:hypothetical protein AQJ11_35975 [Streptomyces corchorusii]|uniref:Uncharacterized protein n=2 Tax=Streptomyces TaxID=1883 RepID=A0A124HJZ7_STRCK|nr:hypothetical protein [Streptomyces corchorusii]KUN18058.1 hypothetical protein AQJ11_35975 [Streptomyces corchorusii]
MTEALLGENMVTLRGTDDGTEGYRLPHRDDRRRPSRQTTPTSRSASAGTRAATHPLTTLDIT